MFGVKFFCFAKTVCNLFFLLEFDVVKLNELVDFYLIKAHSYRECLFEENQSAMSTTSPIDDMVIINLLFLKCFTCFISLIDKSYI